MRPSLAASRAALLTVALAILIGIFLSFPAGADDTTETFVQSSIDKSYAILNDRSLDAAEREVQFAAQIRSAVDTRRVALFTLGPYGRDASKEQFDGYTSAFADFLTAIYHQALNRYRARNIRVTGSTSRSSDDTVVNAVVAAGAGQSPEVRIGFRVRRSDRGEPIITDFQAEGAWLALTERADFTSYLQQHGGDLTLLANELSARAQRIRSDLMNAETRS
jgi:phospholipid transport system substrate-binding protein